MKKIFLFLILSCFVTKGICQNVTIENAQKVATNWYRHYAPEGKKMGNIKKVNEYKSQNTTNFYIFSFDKGGFVIVSAISQVYPILGYGFSGTISDTITNPSLKDWLSSYGQYIDSLSKTSAKSNNFVTKWEDISDNIFSKGGEKGVEPLIKTTWHQRELYNSSCPEDENGFGGHAAAGCVATALGQIAKYWGDSLNIQGMGSFTYSSVYGNLSVNFEERDYNWNLMPRQLTSESTEEEISETSRLLYHIGVASTMNYSSTESSAFSSRGLYGLMAHYGLKNAVDVGTEYKIRYTYNNWLKRIMDDLDKRRPIFYEGSISVSNWSHAFICDGYMDEFFHFNWGWGGDGDGFYRLDALAPLGLNNIDIQGAAFCIEPCTVIDKNVEWEGFVEIEHDLIIGENATLKIKPGTKVQFNNSNKITCFGGFIAEGTIQDSIYFFPKNTTEGFNGLRFYTPTRYTNTDRLKDSVIFNYCNISSSKKEYNIGIADYKQNSGGAIYVCNKPCLIENNKINNCSAASGGAIVILNSFSETRIRRCDFSNNSAKLPPYFDLLGLRWQHLLGDGGAIHMIGGQFMLIDSCSFSNNSALNEGWGEGFGRGGAISLESGSKTKISNCTFKGNYASEKGGAILFFTEGNSVENSIFNENNTNYFYGGDAINDLIGNNKIINSLFYSNGNKNSFGYKACISSVSKTDIFNCDIINNYGWGILRMVYSNLNLRSHVLNSIVYGNIGNNGDSLQIEAFMGYGEPDDSIININYSIIQNKHKLLGNSFIQLSDSIYDLSPGFTNEALYDFSLKNTSHAINKGGIFDFGIYTIPEFDLAGNNRIYKERIDIGCYECQESSPIANVGISPSNHDIGSDAGSTTFTITSNISWTVSDNADWLAVTPTSGSNNETLTASFTANTSTSSRSGIITVSGTGAISQSVTITQSGKKTLSVSPTYFSFVSGWVTITISSNTSWTVSSDDWLLVNPTNGSGDMTLMVYIQENCECNQRVGNICIAGEGVDTQCVIVDQFEYTMAPIVSPSSQNVGSAAGITTFSYETGSPCPFSPGLYSDAAWVNVEWGGEGIITATFASNTLTTSRVGTIRVEDQCGHSILVVIIQEAATAYLNVSSASLPLGYQEGSSGTFNITSNVDWTISSVENWFTLSDSYGSGDATISVTAQKNSTTNARTANISVSGTGVTTPIIITVTQDAAPAYLNVSSASLPLGYQEGSSGTFDITSNTNWTASSSEAWLTVSKASSSGNATITVTAQKNPTVNTRNATVTIIATGLPDKTVIITQSGSPTGISNTENNLIKIYPNPANTVLFIKGLSEETQVSVYNIQGNQIINKQLIDYKLDISNLASGIYTLMLVNKVESITLKFVKN